MQRWVTGTLFILVWLTVQHVQQTTAQNKVVCYFSSWATYRPGNGKFEVEDIDPFLCTHVIYAFVGLNWDGTVRIMDVWNELELNALNRFNGLKLINPNLKTLVAIGGWNEGSVVFSQVSANTTLRATFVQSVYNFVKNYKFDGLDIDWEYPAQRGGAIADKVNYVTLLKEVSAKFTPSNLLLTIAVSAAVPAVATSYNVPEIMKYVTFVNLMTYDFHGSWESTTGIHSPLYPSSLDTDLTVNADATVRYWLQQGASPLKLLLGAPMFGRSFTLFNVNSPGIGAATIGPGAVGPYTQESGFLGYNEICELMQSTTWNLNWARQQKVPFAFRGSQWVGFDNVESVRIKAEYAKMKGLGGMLVWGIETDDSQNICGRGKFPLINSIKSSLNKPGVSADAYPATQGPWQPSTVQWADPAATTTTSTTKAPLTTTTKASTTTTAPPTTTTKASSTTTAPPTTTTKASTTTTAPPTTTTKASTTTTAPPITTTAPSITTTAPPTTTTNAPTTTTAPPTTTTKAPTTTTAPPTTTTKAPTTTTATPVTTTATPITTTALPTTTTKAPTTTTKVETTTVATTSTFTCTAAGNFRDPTHCAVFYYCQSNRLGGFNKITFRCENGLLYDTELGVCNYSYNVEC